MFKIIAAATPLTLAATLVLSGCSTGTITPSRQVAPPSSTSTQGLVDVAVVWQTEPLPDCPKAPVTYNGDAPQTLSLPSKATVADQLKGVRSPASESWVRTKLGWLTKWLAQTRADIIPDPSTPGARAESQRFGQYVEHVRDELEAGQDISKPDLDGRFPEGCA